MNVRELPRGRASDRFRGREKNMTQAQDRAARTQKLQAQFICPIWAVWFGSTCSVFYTSYHAEQFMRALRLNGTPFDAFSGKGETVQ